mgnify:CR=1 FL=1
MAIPIGAYSAMRQDTAGDYIGRSFSILMLAVPSFWMGTMVMVFPSIWWGWSPEVKFVNFTTDPVQCEKRLHHQPSNLSMCNANFTADM